VFNTTDLLYVKGKLMEQVLPMISEFVLRKDQVLNLEMRQFYLIIALQTMYVIYYILLRDRLKENPVASVLAFLSVLVIFLELLAINGKMGLISVYLRQMEAYMLSLGYKGVVWESKALDSIIFRPGNAFTLPAGLVVIVLIIQNVYSFNFTLCGLVTRPIGRVALTVLYTILLIALMVRTITVDFWRTYPNVFQ
jgi:hypothetical protein